MARAAAADDGDAVAAETVELALELAPDEVPPSAPPVADESLAFKLASFAGKIDAVTPVPLVQEDGNAAAVAVVNVMSAHCARLCQSSHPLSSSREQSYIIQPTTRVAVRDDLQRSIHAVRDASTRGYRDAG